MTDNHTHIDFFSQLTYLPLIKSVNQHYDQLIRSTNYSQWLFMSISLLIGFNCVQKLIGFIKWQNQLSSLPHEPYNLITGHIHKFGIGLTTLTNLPEKGKKN